MERTIEKGGILNVIWSDNNLVIILKSSHGKNNCRI